MSVFGEIAKNVGEEVAKGLEKNVAPVVKKTAKNVVDTVEGWGFQPKPGEVASKDMLEWTKRYDAIDKKPAITLKDQKIKEKKLSKLYDNYETYSSKMLNSMVSGKLDSRYVMDHGKMIEEFATLEKMGVPRKYTGKIFNYVDDPDGQEYIANTLKELNPPQRDVYIHLLTTKPSGTPRLKLLTKELLKDLTRPQQETFASMLPQWDGSMEDLVEVAKTL